MAKPVFYAHTLPDRPEGDWQILEAHLLGVSKRAAAFGEAFGAAPWAGLAGLWHDLGKYSDAFQHYLASASDPDSHQSDSMVRTDHSTAGAQHAVATINVLGHLLAFAISGHHAGLLDAIGEGASLERRLGKKLEPWVPPSDILNPAPVPSLPPSLGRALGRRDAFSTAFFTRMLFSCLVDADFLDTERFMDPVRADSRPVWPKDILLRMEQAVESAVAAFGPATTEVNRQREAVRKACLDAAPRSPGLFSLTVPTGGGKTLSSLTFALRHAIRHGLKRVIYVIPFTSIIEQNAGLFREVMSTLREELGVDPVLEHHSSIDVGTEDKRSRLLTENWDAPLVVTTSVQFYESLFAARTSRCRKLHNLSRAVIILDEVQTLPVDLLTPCLAGLRELAANYGSSIVLCTATQPAVHRREGFDIGLEEVREIIPQPNRLYESLKRVDVVELGKQTDEEIAELLLDAEQVLCIVNTRAHAQKLFEAIGKEEAHLHLSASMCPEHRSEILRKVRRRLDQGRPCRVISTQLVEAGVDIDFPTVYRSLAGLDSIAQAAGRCNRNGKLSGRGTTYVFQSEHTRAEAYFSDTANAAAQVLEICDDPLSLTAVERYFKLYYWDQKDQKRQWDSRRIMDLFRLDPDEPALPFNFKFATAASKFKLIDDAGCPVIVPWKDRGEDLCTKLRYCRGFPSRELLQALQKYTVQAPRRIWEQHLGRSFEMVHERYPILTSSEINYDDSIGLVLDEGHHAFLMS